MRYHVMRQEAIGNPSLAGSGSNPACFCSPEGAEYARIQLEKLGDGTHWVQPVLRCPHQESAPAAEFVPCPACLESYPVNCPSHTRVVIHHGNHRPRQQEPVIDLLRQRTALEP